MTSSTSAATPPAPSVRLRDPGELLAGVPFLLGFHPHRSLLFLALGGRSGRRVELVQRVDLPPPEHATDVCRRLAVTAARAAPTAVAVLVVEGSPAEGTDAPGPVDDDGVGPPHRALVTAATAALAANGLRAPVRAWAAGTAAGRAWACYDPCGCRGRLPDVGATPLAATAVAAGVVVHADRAALERLVAPVAAEVLRRRERMLARAVDARLDPGPDAPEPGDGPDTAVPADRDAAVALVDAALADAAANRLCLDDGRVVALAVALADPLVRDAALVRSAEPGAAGAEQLWAALTRETPDPEAAEPAALLAACALLRGDGALAGIALDRALQAWPAHRLTGLLRAAWERGVRPEQVRECLATAPLPPAARARLRRGRRR